MAASHACRPCRNHFGLALIAPPITRLTSPESASLSPAADTPSTRRWHPNWHTPARHGSVWNGIARRTRHQPASAKDFRHRPVRPLHSARDPGSAASQSVGRCFVVRKSARPKDRDPSGRSRPKSRRDRLGAPVSSRRTNPARWRRRHFSMALNFTSASSASIHRHDTPSCLAPIDIAIDALPIEISRPAKPSWTAWTSSNANASSGTRTARDARSGKLSAAERSALNQALAKALAFRDAGKMPEARRWAAELVRLLKSHDLLT